VRISDLRKPTQVRTRKYGTLTLRRLSSEDNTFLLNLRKSEPSSLDLIAHVIHRQLASPTIALDVIRAWDKRMLKRVARLWLEDEIKRKLPAKDPTFDDMVSALYAELTKLRETGVLPGSNIKGNPATYGIASAMTGLGEWDKLSKTLSALSQPIIGGLPQSLAMSAFDDWDAVKGWVQPEVDKIFASGIVDKWSLSEASKTLDWIADVSRIFPLLSEMESTFAIEGHLTVVDVSSAWRETLIGNYFDMKGLYGTFIGSLAEPSPKLLFAYPELPKLSAWEVFNTADLIGHILLPDEPSTDTEEKQHTRDEISADIEASLPNLLASLDVGLCNMWQGAKAAIASKNPDRVRHALTSLRELFTHVLHLLSPDDEVKKWTSSPEHYDEKKRPTRRARVLYICRGINDDDFSPFVETDVDSVLKTYTLFNKGTHSIAPSFNDAQLRAIAVKVDGALRFLIQISRTD
jgi:hypothetical protein